MTAAVMGMPTASTFETAFGGYNKSSTTTTSRRRSHPDVLERFFSGWEATFCAPRSIKSLANEADEEPDVLDYVFEHVESFTCTEGSLNNDPFFTAPPYAQQQQQQQQQHAFYDGSTTTKDSFDLSLRRENSLVEEGPNGTPTYLATTRQPSLLAKLGEEGDLLDYCFEHVESYVCTEVREVENEQRGSYSKESSSRKDRTPMRNTTNQHRRHYNNTPETSHPIPRLISTTRDKKKKRRQKKNYYPDEEDNILLYYRPMKTN
jgi:hypothetical protein